MVDPTATPDQKTYCMLMHLSLILATVFPILSAIVPLIMWQIKRGESPFVDDHGKESLNFHITLLIYAIPGVLLIFTGLGACIGIPMLTGVYVLGLVGLIISAIAAQNGEYYRYPMCIRVVR